MALSENLKIIYKKTYISFIIFILLGIIISFLVSYFSYSSLNYNRVFFNNYLVNNTILIFFKNLLLMTLIFIVFCYSLVIGKDDIITKDGSTIHFYLIISRGLYIIVILNVIYILTSEILIPKLENDLEILRNSTLRANISLKQLKKQKQKVII